MKLAGALSSGDNCGADNGDGDCREQWVAIFGGGYADDGDPNLATYIADPLDPSWSDRSKSIFMVRMDTGEVLSSVEFDATGVTGPSEMKYSIPSAPAVLDLDFDGFADVVYIGDLGGQLWKWDLTNLGVDSDFDDEIDNWPSGVFFRSDPVAMGGGAMHYRSIFAPPSAAYSNGMLNLALGSGERSNLNYPGDASYDDENRFFVVKDPYPTGALAFSVLVTEADLTDISGLDTDFNPTDFGFFFKAEESEKFMTTHTIFAGFVITASYIPDLSGGNICDQSGESRIYVFDLTSGLGFFTDATTTGDDARRSSLGPGAPTDPKITISTNGDYIYVQTSAARLVRIDAPPRSDPLVSTIYWRQIF